MLDAARGAFEECVLPDNPERIERDVAKLISAISSAASDPLRLV